jgi:hypothetical protein
MTTNTVLFPTLYLVILSIIVMSLEGALIDTNLAPDTPLWVPFN